MAEGHIALHPESKVLVLGSDNARYGLNTAGEATQGAGAVALVISADPKVMVLEEKSAYLTADIMDFWLPVYSVRSEDHKSELHIRGNLQRRPMYIIRQSHMRYQETIES